MLALAGAAALGSAAAPGSAAAAIVDGTFSGSFTNGGSINPFPVNLRITFDNSANIVVAQTGPQLQGLPAGFNPGRCCSAISLRPTNCSSTVRRPASASPFPRQPSRPRPTMCS
ncbi:hypothetical protein [Paracraurococcus ruber]|uniref:hypothetical protein n=1 Tax=Paracraurococcus ruber TaxID=77675 RepID=UPI001057F366|nr:hypothetical protein [Paracraurococcus ruber]TDG29101.1 hypothetical protein E2C05_18880 [Paracraurococcus ruber]